MRIKQDITSMWVAPPHMLWGGPKRVKEKGVQVSNCIPLLPGSVFCSVLPHLLPLSLHYRAVSGLLSPVVNHNKLRTHNDQVAFNDSEFPQYMKTIRYREPGQKQLKILTALKKRRKVWQRPGVPGSSLE